MFSRPVNDVSKTKIFARIQDNSQYIVYQMEYNSDEDNAMILPIPVVPNSDEDSVEYINLEKHSSFFDDLHECFVEKSRGLKGYSKSATLSMDAPLKVKDVGSFQASFIPTLDDFSRLDKRFTFDQRIWDKIPLYNDWGFVVFKLKAGNKKVHPMAFKFPTRYSDRVYFPTMHIHDGEIHDKELFDHMLYLQSKTNPKVNFQRAQVYSHKDFEGIVDKGQKLFRKQLNGNLQNSDRIYTLNANG